MARAAPTLHAELRNRRRTPQPFNVSYRRVGGLRLLKLGRLTISFSVSRSFKPIKGT